MGRRPRRGVADLVVARSFGPPSVVAECAAPMLRLGGWLVVSEPPTAQDRWAGVSDAPLGLSGAEAVEGRPESGRAGGDGAPAARFVRIQRVGNLTTRLPRRPAAMTSRPWF